MFTSFKSAKFIRVVLSLAITLLTIGVLVRPQGSAQAVDYTLTTCNVSEFITAWNNAIATSASDTIYLKAGCTYVFTAANASGRALADLPAIATAGTLYLYGNGSTITRSTNNFGFLRMLTNSYLYLSNLTLYNFNAGEIGGALYTSGSLSINSSSFYNNTSTVFNGGAIWGDLGSSTYLDSSGFYANTALDGGAIRSFGQLYISNSAFYGNNAVGEGGAVSLASGTSMIYDTTFGNNKANTNGGAIRMESGVYTLRNNTLYENSADFDANDTGDGGGLFMSGSFTTPVVMHNTVIAKNDDGSPSGTQYEDVSGSFNPVAKSNFIGVGTGLSGITHNINGNQVGTTGSPLDPLLSTLANRPGISSNLYYYVPLPNSPLINSGNNAEYSGFQDGRLYIRRQYTTVDIGAIEFKRPDSPVVVNPANQAWLFRNYNAAGAVDFSFLYGQGLSDYQPLNGDWNGDDIDTQGVYTRFSASNIGVFALSNTFNGFDVSTLPAFVYTDASPNWLPARGDWNADGIDSVGAYNISTGVWVLTNINASTTPSYSAFAFGGGAGILPVQGDWDGDGGDSIGVYNFANNRFILSNGITGSATVNFNFVYGAAGSYPIVGDWDGDGIDTPGLYNPTTGQWLLRNSNTTGAADIAFVYGQGAGLIGRAGQWKTVLPGNGTSPIRELAATPVAPDAPQIAPTFAP